MTSQQAATERGKILGMVIMGCDLEVAAHTVGWTEQRLKEERQRNPEFAADLALREGGAELHHMKNVHRAGEDVKNWRASVWWLVRKSTERRERKQGQALTRDEVCLWVEDIVEIIGTEVEAEEDRDRVTLRLLALLDAEDRETAVELAGREDFDEVYGNASTTSC